MQQMVYDNTFMSTTVMVVSSYNSLTLGVVKKLVDKKCKVNILSSDKDWLSEKSLDTRRVRVIDANKVSGEKVDYIINFFFRENYNSSEMFERVSTLFAAKAREVKKFLNVTPLFVYKETKENIENNMTYLHGLFKENFLQIFSPLLINEKESKIDLLRSDINILSNAGVIKLPDIPNKLYIADKYAFAAELLKKLFSFRESNQKTLLYQQEIDKKTFLNLLKNNLNGIKLKTSAKSLVEFEVENSVKIDGVIDDGFWNKIKIGINKKPISQYKKINIDTIRKKGKNKNIKKKTLFITAGFLTLFVIVYPLIMIFAAYGYLYLAKTKLTNGDFDKAKNLAQTSTIISKKSEKTASIYKKIPIAGFVYKDVYKYARLSSTISELFFDSTEALDIVGIITNSAKSGADYEVDKLSLNLSRTLDSIFVKSGFLQNELEDFFLLKYLLKENSKELLEQRKKLTYLSHLVNQMPNLLGKDTSKKYIIIFQNNMELRPSGGFIGSFALVTFNNGSMINYEIFDVYSADGQLKGYVAPPSPIKEYLGEASWYLRDANWDPDFTESAQNIEWFLEKELDEKVDGVIGMDLEFVSKIIDLIGPIELSDYNTKLTSDNFYEITQQEVEKDFFPGSRKKAKFLTSLANSLVKNMFNSEESMLLPLGIAVAESLEEKHLQIYLHDNKAQESIYRLGWAGEAKQPECEGNCYVDWFGLVDANVGVNKANYHTVKSLSTQIIFSKEKILRKLAVSITNKDDSVFGEKENYRTYLRLLVGKESDIYPVEITDKSKKELKEPEIFINENYKEAGIFTQVDQGQSKVITYSWEIPNQLDLKEQAEYIIYWRKQAGTLAENVSLTLDMSGLQANVLPQDNFLTNAQGYSYNTQLSTDLVTSVYISPY